MGQIYKMNRGRGGHDRVVVTYAISGYQHLSCKYKPCSWRGVLDTILYDKVCH
jgi:hypothetical protein